METEVKSSWQAAAAAAAARFASREEVRRVRELETDMGEGFFAAERTLVFGRRVEVGLVVVVRRILVTVGLKTLVWG